MKKWGWMLTVCLLISVVLLGGGTQAKAEHNHDMVWKWNVEFHWEECASCGEKDFRYTHAASCTDPNTCVVCGATAADGIVIDDVYHEWGECISISATEHQYRCTNCGELEAPEKHWADCTTPNTCEACGSFGGIVISQVSHGLTECFSISATEHRQRCKECGALEAPEPHVAACNDPDTCWHCGATTADGIVMGEIYHGEWEYVSVSATEHQQRCRDCGKAETPEKHWSLCADPDTCWNCGAATADGIVIDQTYHAWGNCQSVSATEHQYRCEDCGEKAAPEKHWAECSDPDTCGACGKSVSEGITIDQIVHSVNLEDWKKSDKAHTATCSECGEAMSYAHFAMCTDPDTCVICGASAKNGAVIENVLHPAVYELPWEKSTKEHWITCPDCGVKAEKAAHSFDAGKTCTVCGYRAGTDPGTTPEPLPAPKYSVAFTFDKEAMTLTGTIVHQAGTAEAEQVYARITFFMADGTYLVVSTIVNEDGSFESMNSGDVVHIAIQASNSTKIRPGDYQRLGGSESDVK